MSNLNLKHFILFVAFIFSSYSYASIEDFGNYTYESSSGLDWLDLTETASRSYADVSSLMDPGEEFYGWQYATTQQVIEFFGAFGGQPPYTGLLDADSSNSLEIAHRMWGIIDSSFSCGLFNCSSTNISRFMHNNNETPNYYLGIISDRTGSVLLVDLFHSTDTADLSHIFPATGSALVRPHAPVPLPPSIALLGCGLLGLFRLKHKQWT